MTVEDEAKKTGGGASNERGGDARKKPVASSASSPSRGVAEPALSRAPRRAIIPFFLRRNLVYYWRTNLAVVFGVAVAVAVLAGALLVGESVRASLRELFLERLGRAEHVVIAQTFFREQLVSDIEADAGFADAGLAAACPLLVLDGSVTHEPSGRRAGGVQVYGVDERFWKFHGRSDADARAPGASEIILSAALAGELEAATDDDFLLRVEKPSDIPIESLHGRKEDVGRTLRLKLRRASPAASELGEFSLRPQQSAVRAVFVSLATLQKNLEREGAVNAMLTASRDLVSETAKPDASRTEPGTEQLRELLRKHATLEDSGLKLRALDAGRGLALESESGLIGDALSEAAHEAARRAGMRVAPVLSYLANGIRTGAREVPYSVVTAVEAEAFARLKAQAEPSIDQPSTSDSTNNEATPSPANNEATSSLAPIVLNEWAAEDLNAREGDAVTLEYFIWEEGGRLVTKAAQFRLAGIVRLAGEAADRDLVPEYPGITETASLADWNPPFPVELARIRPRDEDYWDAHRTTPKAFVVLERGQELWGSRFGRLSSLRLVAPGAASPDAALEAYRKSLQSVLDPAASGMRVEAVRAEGLAASRGATDFGEYFLYFSFFLVASSLLLVALFFKLGIEQRLREVGTLQAIGFPVATLRRIFLAEGVALAVAGSALGLLGARLYGGLMMHGLRTWWVGAVGTTALTLHASPVSFIVGGAGGVVAALACIWWTMRGLKHASPRGLLAGSATRARRERRDDASRSGISRGVGFMSAAASKLTAQRLGMLSLLAGLLLLVAAAVDWLGDAAGFFGGGTLALVGLLSFQSAWLQRRTTGTVGGNGWPAVARLGARNATDRPARSVLCITLIASAVFIVVAVDAFRRGEADAGAALERKSGTGGYALLAESLLPVVHDPNTPEGRDALNLTAAGEEANSLGGVAFARFRLRPGDDTSCLNLYRPRQPRLLAPTGEFIRSGRFNFQSSLAGREEERDNPWLLLEREYADGATPVIGDANSLAYVLHLKPGEDFVLERGAGAEPVRLRVVAALADSVFQGELLMSEKNFLRLFPEEEGYRFFLLDVAAAQAAASDVAGELETRLADFGFDVRLTSERLASFHRVENTYLSTFQMLGGLGLALGTLGLAAVLLRNVLERRRELALLRAVGYNKRHFALMVLAENALLLFCGLLTGTFCALVAIAPVVAARGGQLPFAALGGLLLAVVVAGLASSLVATLAALRSPLLAALRAE